MIIDVIIPAFNEELAIESVMRALPKSLIRHTIVCDNGSTDATARYAARAGAIIVQEDKRGYGNACLAGIEFLKSLEGECPDIVVFIDADYSDFPDETLTLVNPILFHGYDMVIGSRAVGNKEKGSMTPQQIFGNWLAIQLIRVLYGYRFTDLGPFRAVRWKSLLAFEMQDKTYGWTVEMQVKAAKMKLKCIEVPVSYRRRIGKSKVSGTIKGSFMAGYKILWTIFKLI